MRHVPETFRALRVCDPGADHEASGSGSRPRGGRKGYDRDVGRSWKWGDESLRR